MQTCNTCDLKDIWRYIPQLVSSAFDIVTNILSMTALAVWLIYSMESLYFWSWLFQFEEESRGWYVLSILSVLLSSSESVITWQDNSDPGSSITRYCQVVPSATTSTTSLGQVSQIIFTQAPTEVSMVCQCPSSQLPPSIEFGIIWQSVQLPRYYRHQQHQNCRSLLIN